MVFWRLIWYYMILCGKCENLMWKVRKESEQNRLVVSRNHRDSWVGIEIATFKLKFFYTRITEIWSSDTRSFGIFHFKRHSFYIYSTICGTCETDQWKSFDLLEMSSLMSLKIFLLVKRLREVSFYKVPGEKRVQVAATLSSSNLHPIFLPPRCHPGRLAAGTNKDS